jgi:hypothetical protein
MLLLRQGGGRTNESFDDDFFTWLSRHIPVIEDCPYTGIDFLRDLEIPVPPGEERGEMGKFTSLFCCCFCETYVIFMLVFFIYHFFYTRVFDGYVSIVSRCGTSVTCVL